MGVAATLKSRWEAAKVTSSFVRRLITVEIRTRNGSGISVSAAILFIPAEKPRPIASVIAWNVSSQLRLFVFVEVVLIIGEDIILLIFCGVIDFQLAKDEFFYLFGFDAKRERDLVNEEL